MDISDSKRKEIALALSKEDASILIPNPENCLFELVNDGNFKIVIKQVFFALKRFR